MAAFDLRKRSSKVRIRVKCKKRGADFSRIRCIRVKSVIKIRVSDYIYLFLISGSGTDFLDRVVCGPGF